MIYNLPRLKTKEEVWILNEEVSSRLNDVSISFRSNGKTFSKISVEKIRIRDQISYAMYYDQTLVYNVYYNRWKDDAYRTVTFLEPPTGDFLAWLQINAVKQ
nr:MAG TPA: hypothetical protein [Caudoviricetes sp.]